MLMVPLAVQAESALPAPNWDRELALQTARLGVDQGQVEKWFSLLRIGDQAGLVQSITSYIQSADSSSPVREQALYEFTQGLANFSATAIPASLLNLLASYTPQTLVANEENFTSAVPLFNVPAAAQGVKHAFERQQGENRSAEMLANQPRNWVAAYLAASGPERGGFIDALDGATATQLQAIGNTAMGDLQQQPALLIAAAKAAMASGSREAVEKVLLTGRGPELSNILQEVARDFSSNDQALLLLSVIENAPMENAALAIALLTPGLRQVPAVADTLFDLLGDAALGSSAALALSSVADSAIDSRLKTLAASDGAGGVQAQSARISQWVENAPQNDNNAIALGYPVPIPVDTPLPFDGFRTYAGLHARHQDLAQTTPWVHPVAVGTTHAGRTVWAYRLGDVDLITRQGLAEPAMLSNGGIHAREWQSPETVTGIMELLVDQQDDQHLYSYLRDNVNVIVLPVLNVDGFIQTQRYPDSNWMGTDPSDPEGSPRDGRMRRKNMPDVDESLVTQGDHLNGVDLNRNNLPYWHKGTGSSGEIESIVYRGIAAASELEILALDAAAQLGPVEKLSMYTDLHSYSKQHLWAKSGNARLARQMDSLLRTFSRHHDAFPAGKYYAFTVASGLTGNQGIGTTDEYFTYTYQVPSWTFEIEPGNAAGVEYGGLGRNGHDGFILPASQIRRVRTELAQTFAVAYYRQAGPPAVSEFRLVDKATGATVYEAAWDAVSDRERALYQFQSQAVQLGRQYTAWIAFDKPMRWQNNGEIVVLPGQIAASLDVDARLSINDVALNSSADDPRWLNMPGGAPNGYHHYFTDTLAIDFSLPADTENQSAVSGTASATVELNIGDMTSMLIDADPSSVARWESGAWSGYENAEGVDKTDTGGTDSTLHFDITSANPGEPFVIEAGTSSAWFDPQRNGEGFMLEILAGDRALMTWYTYDDQGQQDWYIAVGEIRGNRIVFPELLQVSGGKFGPGFDPSQVVETVVGSASFIWSDCDSGAMEWELDTGGTYRHGRMQLTRLSRVMGIDCGKVLLPPERAEAQLSGSWFDPTHAGEGFALELLIDSRALVNWFTFDANGKRRWFIGVGKLAGGHFVFDDMLTTHGPVFGELYDPADLAELPWGSLELDLQCGGGKASFSSTEPGFPAGKLNLVQLTSLKGLTCP